MRKRILISLLVLLIFVPIQVLNFIDSLIALTILLYLIRVYYTKFKYKSEKGYRTYTINIKNKKVTNSIKDIDIRYVSFSKIKTLLLLGLSLVLVMHLPRLFLGNIITYLGGN